MKKILFILLIIITSTSFGQDIFLKENLFSIASPVIIFLWMVCFLILFLTTIYESKYLRIRKQKLYNNTNIIITDYPTLASEKRKLNVKHAGNLLFNVTVITGIISLLHFLLYNTFNFEWNKFLLETSSILIVGILAILCAKIYRWVKREIRISKQTRIRPT